MEIMREIRMKTRCCIVCMKKMLFWLKCIQNIGIDVEDYDYEP